MVHKGTEVERGVFKTVLNSVLGGLQATKSTPYRAGFCSRYTALVLNTWMYVRMYGSKLVNLIFGGISPHTEDAESCVFFIRQNLAGKLFITVKQM